jgi:plasmid maintenance system antidote protein VapI
LNGVCQLEAQRSPQSRRTFRDLTALRLGKFFKTGAAFWMNIQARFDLETDEDALAPQIRKIVSYEAA